MDNITNNLTEAVNTLIEGLEKDKGDLLVNATVQEVKDNGSYLVETDSGTKFYLTTEQALRTNARIVVRVPEGDWTQTKTLVGVISTKIEDEYKKHINFLNSLSMTGAMGIKFTVADEAAYQALTPTGGAPYPNATFDQWRFDIRFANDIDEPKDTLKFKLVMVTEKGNEETETIIFDQDDYIGSNNISSAFWQHAAYKITDTALNDNIANLKFRFYSNNKDVKIFNKDDSVGLTLHLGYAEPALGWKITPEKQAYSNDDFKISAEYYNGGTLYCSWNEIAWETGNMHLLKYVPQYEKDEEKDWEQLNWQTTPQDFITKNNKSDTATFYKVAVKDNGSWVYSDTFSLSNAEAVVSDKDISISGSNVKFTVTDNDQKGQYYYSTNGSLLNRGVEYFIKAEPNDKSPFLDGKRLQYYWEFPKYTFDVKEITPVEGHLLGADGSWSAESQKWSNLIPRTCVIKPASSIIPSIKETFWIAEDSNGNNKKEYCQAIKEHSGEWSLEYKGADTDTFYYSLNDNYKGATEVVSCLIYTSPSNNCKGSCYLKFLPFQSNGLNYRLEVGYADSAVHNLVIGDSNPVQVVAKLYNIIEDKESGNITEEEVPNASFDWELVKQPPYNENKTDYLFDVKFSSKDENGNNKELLFKGGTYPGSVNRIDKAWIDGGHDSNWNYYTGNSIWITPPTKYSGWGGTEVWNYVLKVSTTIKIRDEQTQDDRGPKAISRTISEYLPLDLARFSGSYMQGAEKIIFSYSNKCSYDGAPYIYIGAGEVQEYGYIYGTENYWTNLPETTTDIGIQYNKDCQITLTLPTTYSIKSSQDVFCIYGYCSIGGGNDVKQIHCLYVKPVLIDYNPWGENTWLNNILGNTISQSDTALFTPYLAAGTKNKENKFTGVILGEAQGVTTNTKTWGLFGQQEGSPRFEFTEKGEAYIGDENNYLKLENGTFEIKTKKFELNTNDLKIYSGEHKINGTEEGSSIVSGNLDSSGTFYQRIKLGKINDSKHGLELYGPSTISIYNTKKQEGTTLNNENKIFWIDDNGELELKGRINATSGTIGNFKIDTRYLQSINGQHGMDSSEESEWAFWAGYKDDGTYAFKVSSNGAIYSNSNFTITGSLNFSYNGTTLRDFYNAGTNEKSTFFGWWDSSVNQYDKTGMYLIQQASGDKIIGFYSPWIELEVVNHTYFSWGLESRDNTTKWGPHFYANKKFYRIGNFIWSGKGDSSENSVYLVNSDNVHTISVDNNGTVVFYDGAGSILRAV